MIRILVSHNSCDVIYFLMCTQAAVTGIRSAFYVVASKSSIRYVVHVTFEQNEADSWINILQQLLTECAPWVRNPNYSTALAQLPQIPTKQGSLKQSPYSACPDQSTFITHFALTRQLIKHVKERGNPLPIAKYNSPFIIAWWNRMKGMTDIFSRVMKNHKADIKRLRPNAVFAIRFMNAMLYNSHLLRRAFAIEDRLSTMSSLDQLRQALKDEGSFFDSLTDIARSYRVLHPGFSSSPPQDHGAAAMETETLCTDSVGDLQPTSRNEKKRAFLNTEAGLARRRSSGPHLPAYFATDHRCLICDNSTRAYCEMCSYPEKNIYFFCCYTPNFTAASRQAKRCFSRFHEKGRLEALPLSKKPKNSSDP